MEKHTPEELAPMRHTLSHLMAAAVLEVRPDAKPTLGPAIDNGFYYDFDFPTPIVDTDLKEIQKRMKKMLSSWKEFTHEEVSKEQAWEQFANNEYKQELINEIVERGEKITLYTCGGFTDLCRGGHVEHPSQDIAADGFKISHLAGAYWRGDEKNKMLTRIYGLAFATKEDLDAYETQIEEAKKRDHKKLGREMDIFVFSDLVGSGLPLWTPKGTMLRNLLDDYVWELRSARGYERVEIPHITKKDLYEKSGHWAKFQDELFKITTREGHLFAMKPMNCPHHTQIFDRKQWSYREMPQRYANTTACYRDEQSGELSGLSRVRSFSQDDAHVFCRMEQVKDEFLKVWDIVHEFYGTFGFQLVVRLSTHDPAHPDKYLGDEARWAVAEGMLAEIIKEKGVTAIDGLGEAAFYGPKLDFMAQDSLGREWQVATIQLDMNMPESFDLSCINEKGEKERVVMIHAAIMGSIERFMSIMIEHTAGLFPVWLSPTQVTVIPVLEKHNAKAREIANALKTEKVRVLCDDSDEMLGKKIRAWKVEKTPYAIVLGDKEIESGELTLEKRSGEKETISLEALIAKLKTEISTRAL
ncbi:threonine--tRNA ligase [Candidatus Campbellbacteria bacterium]|nr:MAG: threonine--tRNA ligase [Candidatus Campbellbacteria bacterium]